MTRPKDHLIAAAVSEIAKLGPVCGAHQSFRQQVSQIVVPLVDGLAQQLARHEAQDGLLSQAQDEVTRQLLRAELAEVQRPLDAQMARLNENLTAANARIAELEAKLNTPQLHDFASAVVLEAAHQRERWSSSHDVGKQPSDWFWLLGYLGGKALNAATTGNNDKALHHTISTAAACANWHAALTGTHTAMRPGIDAAARGVGE